MTTTPRTFAHMSHDDINECIGMWCQCNDNEGNSYLYVFNGMRGKNAMFVVPGQPQGGGGPGWTLPDFGHLITVRDDLPRVWNSDGTPLVTNPEEHTVDERNRVYVEDIEKVTSPPGTKVRRWVSDWEEVE